MGPLSKYQTLRNVRTILFHGPSGGEGSGTTRESFASPKCLFAGPDELLGAGRKRVVGLGFSVGS